MDADTYRTIGNAVHQEARAWASRWPAVSLSDFEQHGWTVVLEALPSYDPTRAGLATFARRCCGRAFLNFAYRSTLTVHTPKNNEYRFAHLARQHVTHAAIDVLDEGFDLEADACRASVIATVRAAVEVVAARAARLLDKRPNQDNQQNHAAIVGLLLDETTPVELATSTGLSAQTWRRRRHAAHESLLDTLRIARSDAR